ncbi:MAG: hypothetical protein R2825_25780 [Saprospiraceae bacterium]
MSAYTETIVLADYTCMSADPFNNAFWFTHEYMKEDGVWGFVMFGSPCPGYFRLYPTALVTPNSPDLTDSEVCFY